MNKDDFEHRVIGHILFNGALYEIAGQDKEHIIRMGDLGIEFEKPTSEVHYSDLYILENDKIYLDAIRLENCWGRFPVINGVKAVSEAGAIFYKGLKRLVSYTGTIIVKRGNRDICQEKESVINKLFGCNQLLCFTLKNGEVSKTENMKNALEQIQNLANAEISNRVNGLYMRDCHRKISKEWQNLYNKYIEYFDILNL